MIDFADVKLIVTDMDGTLLHSDYSLNEEFFDIYQHLKKLNIRFVVASGRQYFSLLKSFESIKNEIYFISENGGNVMYQEQPLLTQQLDQQVIKEAVEISRGLSDTELILCGLKSAYIEEAHKEFTDYIIPYYPKRTLVSDLMDDLDDKIVKIAIFNKTNSAENVFPSVKHLQKDYLIKISALNWLDISIKDSNKGFALEKIQNILQISQNETMVFGDYLNDVEMMEKGYFNFAMENAHEQLKKIARYTTASNDEDGVLKVLRELIRQREGK